MKQSSENKDELRAFRIWLYSLSIDQLVHAMQIEFARDDDGESHDYHLLKQMIDNQSPPPTPIHPRGVGYRPATANWPSDGRNEDLRVYKNRFTKPRLFQFLERKSMRRKQKGGGRRFDVICRRQVTPDGEVLGLGCTQRQRDADERILKGTMLYRDARCCFGYNRGTETLEILNMLRVVSRGDFLQFSTSLSRREHGPWAPWLAPTKRWFSLQMYLASRFEVALWANFRGNSLPPLPMPLLSVSSQLSPTQIEEILIASLAKALRTTILIEDREKAPLLLDGVLFNILEANPNLPLISLQDFTPLLQIGTWRDKFCSLVKSSMEDDVVCDMEKVLLSSGESVDATNDVARKKKQKKKRRRKPSTPVIKEEETYCEEQSSSVVEEFDSKARFVDSEPPSIERTRKLIIVMSLLEDLVEDVFVKVGLSPSNPDEQTNTNPGDAIRSDVNSKSTMTASIGCIDAERANVSSNPFLSSNLPFPATTPPSSAKESSQQNDYDFRLFNPHAQGDFFLTFDDDLDDGFLEYSSREKSVFADFFLDARSTVAEKERLLAASSTAASIASSTDKETDVVDDLQEEIIGEQECISEVISGDSSPSDYRLARIMPLDGSEGMCSPSNVQQDGLEDIDRNRSSSPVTGIDEDRLRSPSPPIPRTPSPRLSPILLSLEDLKSMRESSHSVSRQNDTTAPKGKIYVVGSLPSSPVLPASNSLTDLRVNYCTDDQLSTKSGGKKMITRRVDSVGSYRNAVMKPIQVLSTGPFKNVTELDPSGPKRDLDACARSETAVEAHIYDERWVVQNNCVENSMMTSRDEATTVSALSQREPEELVTLREERNTFRDMCLTLGAEVAKLKNLLAIQSGSLENHESDYVGSISMYNPQYLQPFFHGIKKATTTIGAMSDAGIHRGDHDSAMSEDGTDHATHEHPGKPRSVQVFRQSSGHTLAGSDISLDQNFGTQHILSNISGIPPLNTDFIGNEISDGPHSRLSKDIVKFLNANSAQLQNDDTRRSTAIQRLSRLVTALWPRAQVKLYGSHVTGLCLPSSDLDFVICLPAVHKNAPAITPGPLEGRNAVNESSQKLLARKLKGESWIDPRSIKIIERTVVPVIKVSTKDTRARMLQLDISFDGPVHHGLEAIDMVNEILQQIPMVRPLVLVLKQFLLDRGLLTAYTGGLSSYCLFLMVTRYLQEQSSSWVDCGSLLMGFLDFYGNAFDPRTTGISVRRRQYFARRAPPVPPVHQPSHTIPPASPAPSGRPDFLRRHSFADNKGSAEQNWNRPPRHVNTATPTALSRYAGPFFGDSNMIDMNGDLSSTKPYTFDPLWVEDPLSAGNNVGRNAFRVFQVQRAFSDAHRALLASLEWDNVSHHNMGVADYPLLKCLLQSEDVFYDIDDHHG